MLEQQKLHKDGATWFDLHVVYANSDLSSTKQGHLNVVLFSKLTEEAVLKLRLDRYRYKYTNVKVWYSLQTYQKY